MSSTSIYLHVPYFYIIQHTPSGMLYAGSKWEEGCHPDTFMIEGGYTTSSTKVNDLIQEDGLGAFKTILILPEANCFMSVYDYETVFLQTNDIAKDYNWLNRHNNDGYFDRVKYGSEECKSYMINKFGVENPMQSETLRAKRVITNLEKYGAVCPIQNQDVQKKTTETNFKKYGAPWSSQSDVVRNKYKATCVEKYGVENVTQNTDIRQRQLDTNNTRYGGEPLQNANVKAKSKETLIDRYGVSNISQTQERRESASKDHLGSTYWNDGKRNYKVKVGKLPEPNWMKGMKPRNSSV